MFDKFFSSPIPFITLVIAWTIISSIFFFIQKKKNISNFKQADSKELKNIDGIIITQKLFLNKTEWYHFDVLINQNSIFVFPKYLYFIYGRTINLIFSDSNKKNTKRPMLLREYKIINSNNIELVYYPSFLISRSRKIYLKNLSQEQISLLENTLNNKSRRRY